MGNRYVERIRCQTRVDNIIDRGWLNAINLKNSTGISVWSWLQSMTLVVGLSSDNATKLSLAQQKDLA